MSWPTKKLGVLVSIKGGGTPSKKVEEYWNGNIPWASVKDLKSRILNRTEDFITPLGVEKSATNEIPKGTIIVPTRMALGKVVITGVDLAINQDLKALFINDKNILDIDYFARFLESKAKYIESEGKGATVKGITLDFLKDLEIPLPPLKEQQRIAAILDKADAIRQKRKQAIELADEFLRSVFLDMFGDPVTNPKGWEVKPLKDGISKITSGWSAKGDNQSCSENELGVLKISAVTSGTFKPEENKLVDDSLIPVGKKLLFPRKGDLLFSRANTRELVGATCIVPTDFNNVFLPDKLWNVELSKEYLVPEYLHMLLRDDKFKDTLTSQATGSSGSMLNISKQKFESTLAPFPSLALQLKFKDIYWKLLVSRNLNDESKNCLDEQLNSLSQKAFSGQL
ncbi:TPA: restriction endonuclease subunit S [Photobacterium damselae]